MDAMSRDDAGDGELWQRATSEPAAFGELFERHGDAVHDYCLRRTASWSTADDLTAAVFLEAWRRRKEVRLHGESILPWLLAVANNVLRAQARYLRRQQRLVAKLGPMRTATADPAEEVAQHVDDERRISAVLSAIKTLSRHEQDVLMLCVWGGLDYEAAAAALNVKVGTVRSRLSRAREHLRQLETQQNPARNAPPASARAIAAHPEAK